MEIAAVVGAELYRRAGLDPERPSPCAAAEVAREVFGSGVIRRVPRLRAEADVARLVSRARIVVRSELAVPRAHFAVGRCVARLWLHGEPWISPLDAATRHVLECRIAAWLVAPPPAVARLVADGHTIASLADDRCITETCAAMRIAECGAARGAVVTTPTAVYRRGHLLDGFGDDDVRAIAAQLAPRSVFRWVIRDEPGRVALLARAA